MNGELQLLKVIGAGAFGVVHQAVWYGMIVAAKVMRFASGQDTTREIEAYQYVVLYFIGIVNYCCRKISHPHILSMICVTTHLGSLTILTNYIDGHNLSHYIGSNENVSTMVNW